MYFIMASKYEQEHFTFKDHIHWLLVIPLYCLLGFFYVIPLVVKDLKYVDSHDGNSATIGIIGHD